MAMHLAHRGLIKKKLSENTIISFKESFKKGYGIETDIHFTKDNNLLKSFKNGIVTVELRGSCSGCPSSNMTLKQGVQNLLCHYIPEVKSVEAI